MGAVYLAEHPFMGRKAAIKVLRREFAEDRGLVERFMNEARAANAIRHANIIDIIDVGHLPSGVPYLMMEYLDGESLAARVARLKRLEIGEAVDIVVQTATALAAAHGKGIVHRDLKPDNLFLLPDESRASGLRVKVLDFGIAKLRGELTGSGAKTQSGSLMGTPPYMSPEQCRGLPDEIDERTDIYAMGIILYELLCGAPPFVSAGWGDIVLMHITQVPTLPRSINPEIPAAVEAVIMKTLAKDRTQRFASMKELQTALRAALEGGPVGARATNREAPTVAAVPVQGTSRSEPATPTSTTTFRTATGEVLSGVQAGDEEPFVTVARRPARTLVLGGVGLVALVVISALAFGARRRFDAGPGAAHAPGSAPGNASGRASGQGAAPLPVAPGPGAPSAPSGVARSPSGPASRAAGQGARPPTAPREAPAGNAAAPVTLPSTTPPPLEPALHDRTVPPVAPPALEPALADSAGTAEAGPTGQSSAGSAAAVTAPASAASVDEPKDTAGVERTAARQRRQELRDRLEQRQRQKQKDGVARNPSRGRDAEREGQGPRGTETGQPVAPSPNRTRWSPEKW